MRMRTIEIAVGAFMLAGILALIFLAVNVSGINTGSDRESYRVTARFTDVAGLKLRAKVTLAGVTIGRVVDIGVDQTSGEAVVGMAIEGDLDTLSTDTGAKVLTEGMIGGRYIDLVPGGEEEYLADGDEIYDTQGALVLENLVGDLVTRLGGS